MSDNITMPVNPNIQQWAYTNIAAAATTVVKSGRGMLHTLVINTAAAAAITIYDNTSAAGNKIGTLQASAGVGTYIYDVVFLTGLTVVTAGASDITVSWS